MLWLNIDKPTKTITVHSVETCRHVQNRHETKLKGIDWMKRDGGWMECENLKDVIEATREFEGYVVRECC